MEFAKIKKRAFWQSFQKDISATFQLSLPIVIGQIGIVLMGVCDTIMVGELGSSNLAASGIANSIFFLIVILGIGVMSLVSPLTATAKSQDNPQECSGLLTSALQISFFLSLIISAIGLVLAFNFHWFKQKPEVEPLAISYFIIIAISAVPMLIFLAFKNFTDGLSMTKPAMYITFVGLLNNIIWNWILIYGKLGFPALGLDGAGYATTITRVFMAVGIAWYIFNSAKIRPYLVNFSISRYYASLSNKILRLGLPAGFQYFFEIGAFSGAAVMIGWLGTNQLAAHQIAINLASLTYMVAGGFAAAGSIRVGGAKGEGSRSKTLRYGSSAMFMAVSFMTVSCGVFIIFNEFLVSLYQVKDPELFQIAASLLILAGFFQLSDGIQVVALGALRGLEDVNIPTIVTLFAYWVVGLPIAYFLGFTLKMDVQGIWIGLSLGLTVSAICLTTRFYILANRPEYYQNLKKSEGVKIFH